MEYYAATKERSPLHPDVKGSGRLKVNWKKQNLRLSVLSFCVGRDTNIYIYMSLYVHKEILEMYTHTN